MVTWLFMKFLVKPVTTLRCQQKGRGAATCPRGTHGTPRWPWSRDGGDGRRAGIAGLACQLMLLRISGFWHRVEGSLHRVCPCRWISRKNKHQETQQNWDTQGQTEGPEAEEGKEEALISPSFCSHPSLFISLISVPCDCQRCTSECGGKQGLPASSLLSTNTLLKWITVSPSPAASLKQDPGLIHPHAARLFSWPWRGTHLPLALVLLLAIYTRNVLFLALLTHAWGQWGLRVVSQVPQLSTGPSLCTNMDSSHLYAVYMVIHLLCTFRD